MIAPLNDIIKSGGYFCGGFVRDYLIRGESFSDIDFCFAGKWPNPYAYWPLIRTEIRRETAETHIDGMKYHCVNLEAIDLTCNLFCFDGFKVYPRPCFQYRDKPVDYFKAWEMLLEKKFVMQIPAIKNLKLRAKLTKRGWIDCGIDLVVNTLAIPPKFGPWSDFALAKERFDALAL